MRDIQILQRTIENQRPEYQAKGTIPQSMPGVGKVLAASLISNVPELGLSLTNKPPLSLASHL